MDLTKREPTRKYFQEQEEKQTEQARYKQRTAQLKDIEYNVVQAISILINFLDNKITKTEVVNQLESIKTPDVENVVKAISKLDADILSNKLDLQPLVKELQQIKREMSLVPKTLPKQPKPVESVSVKNLKEIVFDTSSLEKAVRDIDVKPEVNVKAPIVAIDPPNLKPLQDNLIDVVKAIKAIEYPEFPEIPKTDTSKIEKELSKHTKQLKELIEKPVSSGGGGGNGTPYVNSTGKASNVELETDGSVPVTIKVDESTSSFGKPTDAYSIQAISDDGTYKYFFFEADDADYYILRKHIANKVFDYTKGTGGYSSVYVDATSAPSGSPTWADYGTTF